MAELVSRSALDRILTSSPLGPGRRHDLGWRSRWRLGLGIGMGRFPKVPPQPCKSVKRPQFVLQRGLTRCRSSALQRRGNCDGCQAFIDLEEAMVADFDDRPFGGAEFKAWHGEF